MSTLGNLAAWSPAPKADLVLKEAPLYTVEGDEILIKNEAISIQPFDSRIRRDAYVELPYPFILGNGVAGTVVAVGPDASHFKVGDRVVSDTSVYKTHATKYGAWQRFVVGNASRTVNIGERPFEQAIALPFPLQTAVAALHVYLGMERPGERAATASEQKVLIWGAGGAVGGYAVQYAKSVGYTVIATASPRTASHLKSIGASNVLDYKSPTIVEELRALGPYAYFFTTSGDAVSQKAIGELLQPNGGKFASTLPLPVDLPSNVEKIYNSFSSTAQRDGPEFQAFSKWWYGEYLVKAIRDRAVEPTAFEKRSGGLEALQQATIDVLEGRAKAKLIINPQE